MARISIVDLLERAAAVIVVVAVGLSCLLVGGVHATSHVLMFALAVVAGALDIAARLRRRHPLQLPVPTLPLLAGLGLTALSLVPLPHGVRALLSPESVDRLDRLRPLLADDVAATLRPVLAFDPPDAALALVRLLFAVVVVVVVADRARHRDGRSLLWRGVLVVAFVTGFATVFAYAIGEARFADVAGIPVNANHRARMLGALGLLCLGRALTLRPRVEAAWFAVGGALCALLVPVTASRGGMAALVVGAIALAVAVQRRDGDASGQRPWRTLVVSGVAVVAVGGGALVVAGEERVWGMAEETLAHPDRLKTFLWEPSLRVAVAEPIVGVGNNGFGVAFPSVLGPGELDATLTYTHAENVVLQTLADHGLVGGFIVLFSVVVVIVTVVRHLKNPAERAAVPAVVFLVVGDVFDFVLELPVGIGLAALALGFLSGRLAPHRSPLVSMRPALAAAALVVVVVVGAAASSVAVAGWRVSVDERLRTTPIAERPAALQRALALHPSDATYATQLAIEARRRRLPADALRWANRALVVWPAFREAHIEAARALAVSGRVPQAMLEYREAALSGLDRNLVREIAQRTADVAERRRALPQPETASDLASLCEILVNEKRPVEARACYADVVALPDVAPADVRRALTLSLGDADLAGARALFERLVPVGSLPDGEDAVLGARLRAAVNDDDAALKESETWLAVARDPMPLLQWRLSTLRAHERLDEARATVERMLAGARSLKERQSLEMVFVELLLKRGERARALQQLEETLARVPHDPAVLAQKALVEVELGRDVEARATLDRLRTVAPGDQRITAIEQRLQTAARR